MAKKPTALTPGKGGKGGGPAHHHHPHKAPHKAQPPHTGGGPLTPGGGGTGAPAHRPPHHHHQAHKAKHHPKARHHPKAKSHPKRKLAGSPLDGGWILGGNDAADNCALVAVANALLLSGGLRVPDAELLRIHGRAGPLSIADAFTALHVKSREIQPQPGGAVPWPVVAGLATPHGPHAGLLLSGGLVTWGGVLALPDDWDIEEAWAVTW